LQQRTVLYTTFTPSRGRRWAAILGIAAVVASSAALIAAVPASAAAPTNYTISQADLGSQVGDTTAPWTKANVANASGRYEIVADADKGAVLDLETVGGQVGTGTQSKLMHYFASGAYPATDTGASVVSGDPVATIPLGTVVASPFSMEYKAASYLSPQIEIYYGSGKNATLRQVAPAASGWTTFTTDATTEWTTNTALTSSDGATTYLISGASATLTTILADLDSQTPRAASIGVDVGRDDVGAGLSQLSSISFLGSTFTFVLPQPPANPPAASDAALDQLIATQNIDVDATTDTFSIGGGTPGDGVSGMDGGKPIDATLPWDPTSGDNFVDVYGYSSPVYLGTFPVVNGKVVLTGLDLSALGDGNHRLVFVGQTSDTVSVVAISIAAAAAGGSSTPALAFTGTDATIPTIGGLGLLLLGLAVIAIARTRKQSRRRA
jgi:hypothetical protein